MKNWLKSIPHGLIENTNGILTLVCVSSQNRQSIFFTAQVVGRYHRLQRDGCRRVRNTIYIPVDKDNVQLNTSDPKRFQLELLTSLVMVPVFGIPLDGFSELSWKTFSFYQTNVLKITVNWTIIFKNEYDPFLNNINLDSLLLELTTINPMSLLTLGTCDTTWSEKFILSYYLKLKSWTILRGSSTCLCRTRFKIVQQPVWMNPLLSTFSGRFHDTFLITCLCTLG